MGGNGIANIVAALIVAAAILWNGGIFSGADRKAVPDDKEFAEWYARAVGDIKNDIVVNCGCCGEGEGRPQGSF
jgi:hypothetical protein